MLYNVCMAVIIAALLLAANLSYYSTPPAILCKYYTFLPLLMLIFMEKCISRVTLV